MSFWYQFTEFSTYRVIRNEQVLKAVRLMDDGNATGPRVFTVIIADDNLGIKWLTGWPVL